MSMLLSVEVGSVATLTSFADVRWDNVPFYGELWESFVLSSERGRRVS